MSRTKHSFSRRAFGVLAAWTCTGLAAACTAPGVDQRTTQPPTTTSDFHTKPDLGHVSAPAALTAAEEASTFRDDAPPVPPPATSTVSPSSPEAPPLEEVVARAIPAIVQIETSSGRGSGFFIQPDTVITNVHVVGTLASVVIRRSDGTTSAARVAGTSPAHDLALLRVVDGHSQQAVLTLGSALGLRVGQDVVAIGSALGTLQNTVTRGIVSAIRQSGSAVLVQTDAAVNPGNSGGPLLDRRGVVVGVTTMGYVDRQGLNFAVAAEHARALLEGRSTPAGSAKDLTSFTANPVSETDSTRALGAQAFESAARQLAAQADRLEDDWQRYRGSCRQAAVSRQSREWFILLEQTPLQGSVSPGCSEWLDDLRHRALVIARVQRDADEIARRADVYPGTRRDIRRRYRLDFEGWDQ